MSRSKEPGMPSGRSSGDVSGVRSKYQPSKPQSAIGWSIVDSSALHEAVDAVTTAGDAILISRTSDGAVLVVTICAGVERIKFYWRTKEDADTGLGSIADSANGRSGRQ